MDVNLLCCADHLLCLVCRGISHFVARVLSRSPGDLAAMARTTAAVTDIHVSPPGANVIPDQATATVNFRVLPGTAAVLVLPEMLVHLWSTACMRCRCGRP